MFARGRQPDPVKYKAEVLKNFPDMKVKQKQGYPGITGYVLYNESGKAVLSRRSSRQCWEDFYLKMKDKK